MSNYHQQKKWRASRPLELEGKAGLEIEANEGYAELLIDTEDGEVGWAFTPNGNDESIWCRDDELDFPDDPEITLPRLDAMKAAILHVANQITGPTFTRFCELVPHFAGPRIFSFPETRIHLWHGLSSLAIKALKDLIKEGKLVAERASFALYSIDGGSNSVMRLPRLQKTVAQNGEGFVQPFDCWLPLVFWTIEQIAKAKGKREASRIILTDGGKEKESWETKMSETQPLQLIEAEEKSNLLE